MPLKHTWTDAEDALVRTIDGPKGVTRADVARELGMSSWAVRERMTRIGHRPEATTAVDFIDLGRDPLPAGHEISWGAIVAGSCIEGQEYRP